VDIRRTRGDDESRLLVHPEARADEFCRPEERSDEGSLSSGLFHGPEGNDERNPSVRSG
jgi:hypothetical protein